MPIGAVGALGSSLRESRNSRRSKDEEKRRSKIEDDSRDPSPGKLYLLYPSNDVKGDAFVVPIGEFEEELEEADANDDSGKFAPVIVDMSATGDWNGFSTLEKPRETTYERPPPGCKTSALKILGFFLFFGINGFLIAYFVPLMFKAMLGLN